MKKQLVITLLLALNSAAYAKVADVVSTNAAVTPVINASEVTNINFNGTVPATFTGALDPDDSTFNRTFDDCTGLSGTGTAVAFDTVNITNTSGSAGSITLAMQAPGGACPTTIDPFLLVYSTFNPATPLTGCLTGNDDFNSTNCSSVTFPIAAGQTRTVVTTSFPNATNTAGQFAYEINFAGTTGTPGGGATITPAPVPTATAIVIPTRTLPVASATASFTLSASAASATTCATTSAGYAVAPATLTTLPTGTAVPFTVTQSSTAAGTYLGAVTCTNAVGATPASVVYNYTHTVNAVVVPAIPVPALNSLGALALLAGFGMLGIFAMRRSS
jgi:hypothetical protein